MGLRFFNAGQQYSEEALNSEAQRYGYKAANLLSMGAIRDVDIPPICPLSHEACQQHLSEYAPKWQVLWERFVKAQEGHKNSLNPDAIRILEKLQNLIIQTFIQHPMDSEQLAAYIKDFGQEDMLMVRSTGAEDTEELANPGGNESYAGIAPTKEAISHAIGKVIASYFSVKSLEQRLKADTGPSILSEPFMPVLLQKMVGEGPAEDEMVYSGVMYTSQQGTHIQVAPGHGELVVNSKGAVDNYFVTEHDVVHQQIFEKPVRMVTQKTDQGVSLEMVQNSDELKAKASLSRDTALKLKDIGQQIQSYYGAQRDVEFVYYPKTNTIYIVQARPIPQGLSARIIPRAIAPEHIRHVKATAPYVDAQIITPAGSRAMVVQKPEELLIHQSIDQALTDYLGRQDTNQIKAIIVHKDAPMTSHEAAEFNSLGLPVFYVDKDKRSAIHAMFEQEDPQLILDPQRGLVVDWHDKNPSDVLQEGLFKSSLAAQRTITVDHSISDDQTEKAYQILSRAEPAQLNQKGVYAHMLACLETIEGASVSSIQAPQQALSLLLQYLYQLAQSEGDSQRKQALFKQACEYASEIETQLLTIAQIEDMSHWPSHQKQLLDLVNGLEALVVNPGRKHLYSDSVFQTAYEHKARKALNSRYGSVMKHLPDEIKDVVVQLYRFGSVAANDTVRTDWDKFMLYLAVNHQVNDRFSRLGPLIKQAMALDQGSLLVNNLFYNWVQDKSYDELFDSLEQSVNLSAKTLDDMSFWKIEAIVEQWEAKVSLWAKKGEFDKLMASFEDDFKQILNLIEPYDLESMPPMAKAKVLEEIRRWTEVIDSSLKMMKGSVDYGHDDPEMIQHMSQMLDVYHRHMRWVMGLIPDDKYESFEHQEVHDTLSGMETKQGYISTIANQFAIKQAKVAESLAEINRPAEVFREASPSGYMSVNSVIFNSPANLSYQMVAQFNDLTLEDYFTLFHQNALAAISLLNEEVQLPMSLFPEVCQSLNQQVMDAIPDIQLLANTCDVDIFHLEYNIPLRNHAAKLFVSYNATTRECSVRPEIYGDNTNDRMFEIADHFNFVVDLESSDKMNLVKPAEYHENAKIIDAEIVIAGDSFTTIHEHMVRLVGSICDMTFSTSDKDIDLILEAGGKTRMKEKLEVISMSTSASGFTDEKKLQLVASLSFNEYPEALGRILKMVHLFGYLDEGRDVSMLNRPMIDFMVNVMMNDCMFGPSDYPELVAKSLEQSHYELAAILVAKKWPLPQSATLEQVEGLAEFMCHRYKGAKPIMESWAADLGFDISHITLAESSKPKAIVTQKQIEKEKQRALLKTLKLEMLEALMNSDIMNLLDIIEEMPELINAPLTQEGETALILAVTLDEPEMVDILLEVGADPTLTDKEGYSALELSENDSISQALEEALGRPASPRI